MTRPDRRRFVRVIQHEAVEGPALIAEALAREGVSVEITRVDRGDPVPAGLEGAQGLVVLGGSAGVHEAGERPHLRDEMRLIESAMRDGAPVLGVCLGSQLVAAALGAEVHRGPYPEIGWFPVTPTATAADDRLFAPLTESFVTLHWHGDLFALPDGAVSLASSEKTQHQAYRHGDRTYGLLFHLEVTPEVVRGMVETCGEELDHAGVTGRSLLDGAERWAARAATVAVPLFQRWAGLLALGVAVLGCSPAPVAPTSKGPPAVIADKPNTHGMFMLGTGTLYLCHMPMFNKADHQYQVILRAHLDAATARAYLADRAANPGQPYNLINVDEEPFILPDVASGKIKTFHVNVFRTYSNDNGGTPGGQLAKGAELTVDEVLRFRHFDPAATAPEHLTYLLFGDGGEAHLDHVITREPDFQQVLTLPAVPAWVSKEQLQKGVELVFPVSRASVPCANPLRDADYTVTSGGAKNTLKVGAAASRWFSTGNMLNAKDPCDANAPAHPHPM